MKDIRELSEVLAQIREPALMERYLRSILTPSELADISGRWQLVKMLDQGLSQRHIARALGMSLCKITRGSRELKKKNSAFKEVIEGVRPRIKPRAEG
jgi:TrpR family trp operon transcriptional repressor